MTREDMHTKDGAYSSLVKHMLEHGNRITSVKITASELRDARRRDRAWFLMPHEITDVLLGSVHFTVRHATDLLIGIRSMAIAILDGTESDIRLVAFREDGVDHLPYVEQSFDQWYQWRNYGMMEAYYRDMFLVHWGPATDEYASEGDIEVTLYNVHRQHPYQDPFEPPKEES